jgi:hypothetical protein
LKVNLNRSGRGGSAAAAIAVIIAVGLLLQSCGPKPAPKPETKIQASPPKSRPAPTDLTARVFFKRINLSWTTNRTESTLISGYNVYLWSEKESTDTSRAAFRRVTLEPYPGDTDPGIARESFPLEGLDNGVMYRAFVTTVFSDGTESDPTNIVEAIPRLEGSFTLHESFKGSESGFSLRKMKSVPTDDLDNDLYLATINGALFVASPRRISPVLRQSKFYGLGIYGPLESFAPTALSGKPDNALQVYDGQVYLLQDQDQCYALLRFDTSDIKNKTVRISYIYQPRPNTLSFR